MIDLDVINLEGLKKLKKLKKEEKKIMTYPFPPASFSRKK